MAMVIIGAGQAGLAAAEKLRALGYGGEVVLLGAEPEPPYQRPPLSKAYLMGETTRERLALRPESQLVAKGITLHLGAEVVELEPEARQLRLKDGRSFAYEKLLLATGAAPRRLPATQGGDLAGVLTLRDLRDADALAQAMGKARHLLVLGGGYVGLEVAATARKKGLAVTVIEAGERVLQRVASAETSAYFKALHLAQGVDLRENMSLKRLIGQEGTVCGAELADGSTLAVDLVLLGIGATPNVALAGALATPQGIAVDAHARTADPHIYAAGDCTSFEYLGAQMRLESVGNAIDQAEVAAANMLGGQVTYQPRPWFWSDQYHVKLQIAGLSRGYDQVVCRQGAQPEARSHWYFAAGRLLAVDAMNEPRLYMLAKRLLDAGGTLTPAEAMAPETELRALVAQALA